MSLPQADINTTAVVVGAIISMVLGFVWYSLPVFGKMWMKEIGKKADDLKGDNKMYVLALVAALLLSYVMAHFVDYTGAKTAMEGAKTGFWLWLGFAGSAGFVTNLFSGNSVKLWAINYGYHLVEYILIGALMAAWV